MAENYIQDPELLKQLNEGYVTDPKLLEALNATTPVEQAFSEPKSWWTSPTIPQDFSAQRVGESVALGTGIGAALGAPTGVGVIPGAIGGAASGLVAGVTGEFARQAGAPESVILASEIAGGSLPQITKNIASKGLSAMPGRGKTLASFFETPQVEQQIDSQLRTLMFGKPSIAVNYTRENSLAVQDELRQKLLGESLENLGQNEPTKKVSDIIRGQLYDGLKRLSEQKVTTVTTTPPKFNIFGMQTEGGKKVVEKAPNVFINSPEYKSLIEKMKDLKDRDLLTNEQLGSLNKILAEELSKRPGVKEKASQDILNLIQNGGVFTVSKKGAEAETKTKIPEEARLILRDNFNSFLERNLGSQKYNILKQAEAAEFTAAARDEIPAILETGFRYGSPEMNAVLTSIKNSPEGRKDFANAVNQHLFNLTDEKKMLSEFNRLRPALIEANVFTPKEIAGIYTNIKSFGPIKDQALKLKKIQNAITFPLVGVGSAEMSNKPKSAPLDVFSM